MSGGIEGGHFVGFCLAVLGLATLLLTTTTTRPPLARKLGRRRAPFLVAISLGLTALALFGNGKRQISFRTAVGPSYGVPSRLDQADVDAALDIVTDARFLDYVATLHGSSKVGHPEVMRRAFRVKAGTTVDLMAEGYRMTPPPPLGQSWFFVTYEEEQHALFAALDRGEGLIRWKLAQTLATEVLPHVTALVKLRRAKSEAEKMAILQEMALTVPYVAEWITVELSRANIGASPALTDVIQRKQAYVKRYVEDPTMRGLSPGTKADAP